MDALLVEKCGCATCGKKFSNKRNLRAHERRHFLPNVYACEMCEQVFTDSIVLQHHQKSHNSKLVNECGICHRLFTRKTTLDSHMRLHTNDKKYRCHYCGKSNGTKHDLECHLRTHTGEKPYQCEVCSPSVSFTTRSSLMRHMRTHSGVQPHLCKLCNKTFYRKDQYNRHMNRHLEYHCLGCSLIFDSYAKYTKHLQVCPSISKTEKLPSPSVSRNPSDNSLKNMTFEIPLTDDSGRQNSVLLCMPMKSLNASSGELATDVPLEEDPCISDKSEKKNDDLSKIVHIMIEQDE